MTNRQTLETNISQGEDEVIAYSLTTTPWGSSPTSVVVTVWDITHGSRDDVTATVTSGSATVSGDVITLPVIQDLDEGSTYRVEIRFTVSGQILEAYFILSGEM